MRNPAFRDDPYPLLHALRERGRIERDVIGIWLVGHHADVSAGLRDHQLSREPWRLPAWETLRPFVADSTLERTTLQWMLMNDPPKHTRLRRLVNGAFKPPVIEALRERVGQIADELYMSDTTVKRRLRVVFGKLGVSRRAEAVGAAARRGLI